MSAPPKIGWNRRKSIQIEGEDREKGDKVFIPKTHADLESDSESLSDKIRKIDGFGDVG